MRNSLAVITGIVASYAVIILIELTQMMIYPPPPGLDPMNHDHLLVYMKIIPVAALVFIAVAHLLGTLVGGLVGLKIAGGNRKVGYIIGGIMLTFTVINFFMIPHPVWFMALDVSGVVIAFLVYMKLVQPVKN